MMVSTWWLMVAFVVGIYAGVSLMAVLYFASRETDDVGIHDGFHQHFAQADVEVLEIEDLEHARVDGRFRAC